ncbi:hypothetical protein GA0061098_1008239 [Bradyrhizobium shewense]|uniref:Uncharacterized protein n=1 Tax=Bradyrhizobium shewense TaxID=1761772 RepID=A0A1C3WM40_9BRAD|nr:hypothetical protein GA0061098_1008239 [Bradyrhizobium shewense]
MVLPPAESCLGAQLARQSPGIAERGSYLLLAPSRGAGLFEMRSVVGEDVVDLDCGQSREPIGKDVKEVARVIWRLRGGGRLRR